MESFGFRYENTDAYSSWICIEYIKKDYSDYQRTEVPGSKEWNLRTAKEKY